MILHIACLVRVGFFFLIPKMSIFSQGLECYLLMLLHCINMKHFNELSDLTQDVCKMIRCLENVSGHATVVKPRLYLLIAYFNVIRSRKSTARFYLHRAQKYANLQENKLIAAWIIQNRRVINLANVFSFQFITRS